MNQLELYEKIEGFLKGRLNEDERASFEKEIQADQTLAKEVALYKAIMKVPDEEKIKEFRTLVENVASQTLPTTSSSRSKIIRLRYRHWWALGVAAMALLVFGIWLLLHPKTNTSSEEFMVEIQDTSSIPEDVIPPQEQQLSEESHEKNADPDILPSRPQQRSSSPSPEPKSDNYLALAQESYTPYDVNVNRDVQESDPETEKLELAKKAFTEGDYQEVIALSNVVEEKQQFEFLKLRANAYFMLNQYKNAAIDFQELTTNRYSKYDAEWNLLLCYLAQLPETRTTFDSLLVKLLNEDHPFAQKAKNLQEKLFNIERKELVK